MDRQGKGGSQLEKELNLRGRVPLLGYVVDTFFTLRLWEWASQRAMRPTPVIGGEAPPTQSGFLIFAFGESQGLSNLSFAHQTRCSIAAFDGGSVWNVIAELVESLVNTFLAAMSVTNFNGLQALSLSMFDDLHVSSAAWDAIA